jgi:hypothetical protein
VLATGHPGGFDETADRDVVFRGAGDDRMCIASTPAGCTEPVDVSACVSAANSESCDQVLAAQPPNCELRCK